MAKLIGTAGHVDHGKSTLIRAMTGIDPDRLPEEKERGMTIDIGFAHIDLPNHKGVSVVDVPGHQRFLTNMLVGAQGIDVALLCVAADEGVMPQTREHVAILQLLPVEKMVVALTKCDAVEPEMLEVATETTREFLESTRFSVAPIFPVSAVKSLGLAPLITALDEALNHSEAESEDDWYLPVDRAFSIKGHGVVVTGTLANGRLAIGDVAVVQPTGKEVRIRAIHHHGVQTNFGERGQRTALNIAGIQLEEIERGHMLGTPGFVQATTCLDARVRWVGDAKHGMRVRVAIGADDAIGKLFLSDSEPELVQIRLERPVAAVRGQPLILRRHSPPDLLAGGAVTVPNATPRRKSEVAATETEGSDEERILASLAGQLQGLPTEEICRLLGKSPQALGDLFEQLKNQGSILGFAGLWFLPDEFERALAIFDDALSKLHEKNPRLGYLPRESILSAAKLKWSGKPLDRIIAHLAQSGRIVSHGTGIRKPDFQVQLTDRQAQFLARIEGEIGKQSINVPEARELAATLHVPIQAVEEMLRLGAESARLTRVSEGLYYLPSQIQEIENKTRDAFSKTPFTASAWREFMQTSRKFAIPILEYLDAKGITMRMGEQRVVK